MNNNTKELRFNSKDEAIDYLRGETAKSVWHAAAVTQNNLLVELNYGKENRYRQLQREFKNNFTGKVYMTQHVCYENVVMPFKIDFINYFENQNIDDWSIVVLQNNTINYKNSSELYHSLRRKAPNALFVCWDYDNHHWVSLSTMAAALVDVYIPAHTENVNVISKFNSSMYGPIACATLQWSREFAKKNIKTITKLERKNEPLGHHFRYDHFPYRNGVIEQINRVYKEVALIEPLYHDRDSKSRLDEWTSYKAHWIVPVFNDLPLRLYDAIFTGGIPIIPRTLKGNEHIKDFEDFCVFYDVHDIADPIPIVNRAIKKFDDGGVAGIKARHKIMFENHHIDVRFAKIFKHIQEEFGIQL